MKERPILFSGPMVQAILSGNKTQTRRVIKPQPPSQPLANCHELHTPKQPAPYLDSYRNAPRTEANPQGMSEHWCWWQVDDRQCLPTFRCPYGKPGDRLWLRETFRVLSWPKTNFALQYLADGAIETYWPNYDRGKAADIDAFVLKQVEKGWKPSIHMPAWASRLTLEVCSVRVERLQDISPEDAIAEGIECLGETHYGAKRWRDYTGDRPEHSWWESPVNSYHSLWDSINEKRGYGWDTNPYVWVVEFRKVEVKV